MRKGIWALAALVAILAAGLMAYHWLLDPASSLDADGQRTTALERFTRAASESLCFGRSAAPRP